MTDPRDELVTHVGALRAFAFGLTGNHALADDMVQDTLVKAWTKMDKFTVGTSMRAWLFTILRNTYYSHGRRAKRMVQDADGKITERIAVKPNHDGRLQMRDFMVVFNQLSLEHREVLILVGVNGLSYEDVAGMCGVKVGTVKSRLNRARALLVDLLHLSDQDALELTDAVTVGIVSAQSTAA